MNKIISILSLFISLSVVSCSSAGGNSEEEGVTKDVIKYANGNVHKIARKKANKLYGVQEEYSKSGKLLNTITYLNGFRDGEAIMYHDNGKPYRVTTYVRDKISGKRKKYRDDGKLWSVQTYHEGLPSNDLKEYDEDGKLIPPFEFVIKSTKLSSDKIGVKLSVKGQCKKVEYYDGVLVDGKYFDKSKLQKLKSSSKRKADLVLFAEGAPYDFVAKITTYANNHMYIHKQLK
jgi:hypothetical protein